MADDDPDGPLGPGDSRSETTLDDMREDVMARRRTQRALGYDWGGYDLASPWDTGHEIVAVGHRKPPSSGSVVVDGDLLRSRLPTLDELCTPARVAEHGARRVEYLARRVLEESAEGIESGLPVMRRTVEYTLDERLRRRVRGIINATGSVLSNALGRAPWSDSALTAARRATGYADVDFDPGSARWGARGSSVEDRLCALTGAEAGLAVSSHAAALMLALSVAGGGPVVVGRGDLVELDDGRRLPELIRLSGVDAVAVGTVNRTQAHEYAEVVDRHAEGDRPIAAILTVLHDTFRQVGRVARPALSELVGHGVPLVVDHAIGALSGPGPRTVAGAIEDGADLVCFAGDGLVGGPQCGLVVGRASLIERLRKHPLYGVFQLDKVLLAALEATLDDRLRGVPTPTDVMRGFPLDELRVAVEHWQAVLQDRVDCAVVDVEGPDGRAPSDLPSVALAIHGPDPRGLAVALARSEPAVVGRFEGGALLLDARTVVPLNRGGRLLSVLEAALDRLMLDESLS